MKHKLNIIPLLLVTVAFGLIAWALVHYEENYLWKVQELNLFLDTALFLCDLTDRTPAKFHMFFPSAKIMKKKA